MGCRPLPTALSPPSHVSPCRTLEARKQQELAGPSKHGLREQAQAWVSEGHSPSPSPQPSRFRLWVSSMWPPCDWSDGTNTGLGSAADMLAAAASASAFTPGCSEGPRRRAVLRAQQSERVPVERRWEARGTASCHLHFATSQRGDLVSPQTAWMQFPGLRDGRSACKCLMLPGSGGPPGGLQCSHPHVSWDDSMCIQT